MKYTRTAVLAGIAVALLGSAGVSMAATDASRAQALGTGSRGAELCSVTSPAGPDIMSPAVVSLPSIPGDLCQTARAITTPRARLTLGPRVADPREIVERSGRMGCVFSLRTVIAGIVECLFSGSSFFRSGDPLFRLYDPQILADLAAAEQALSSYEVEPLLIARAPRTARVPGRTARRTGPAAPREPAPAAPRAKPRSAASLKPQPNVKPKPAPAAPKPQTALQVAKPTPAPPAIVAPEPVDFAPFEEAIAIAQKGLNETELQVATCQEDYTAKQRLVELGALAQQSLDASAASLSEAALRRDDAKARLQMARERLASEQEKARRAAEAVARSSTPPTPRATPVRSAPAEVEIIRGPMDAPPEPEVETVVASSIEVEAGVQVIRGLAPAEDDPEQAVADPTVAETPQAQPPVTPAPAARVERRTETPRRATYPTRGDLVSTRLLPKPRELDTLSEQRWTEYKAPSDGFVLSRAVGDGDSVEAGDELIRVINTQWALAYFGVSTEDVDKFEPGTLVTLTFDGYPDVLFEGWVNSLQPDEAGPQFRAEVMVFCRQGYYGTDAFATLQWLALATPLEQAGNTAPVTPIVEDTPERHYHKNPSAVFSLVPQDVWTLSVSDSDLKRSPVSYEGQLTMLEYQAEDAEEKAGGQGKKRLAGLKKWREGFVDGMVRTVFDESTILTYPKSGEARRAVERMSTGRVTHIPNRCARTMREALGWGLGDAHVWATGLPRRGYDARDDGLARPGDILVWPFTYGPRRTQHIGMAVQQNGKLMLLSNLAGNLGTTEILPGYVAFYKPS